MPAQIAKTQTKPLCKLLSVADAADLLGVSVSTIRSWVWQRQIEHVHIGRSVRIREDVLQGIVSRGTVPVLTVQ